jgi:hypothetical protein
MNKFRTIASVVILIGFSLGFSSCSKDEPTPVSPTAFSVATSGSLITVRNLSADPPTGGYNPTNGQPIGVTNKYTLFSFKEKAIVADTDSASTKWDIGFNGTKIIINGGTSGPGVGGAVVQSALFDQVTTAPDAGYVQDNKANPAVYAVPRGSGKGWYNYDPTANLISPKAGVVIIVKTADGKYAKMDIQSYYQGLPTSPTSTTADRYYSFRYVYQPNGTLIF